MIDQNAPFITEDKLGQRVRASYFGDWKNRLEKKPDDVYFSVETKEKGYFFKGYMHRNAFIEKIFAPLIQDSKFNQHIHFIEWSDRYLVMFEDGIYISHADFFMTKEEFTKFKNRVLPEA